ncbi:hypothetical protein CVT25_003064 [Psilocybe cyanescens]|uniref:Uncharacterized protein n=1 Tax=Psilocybe cyanescens TaxID=93625 RepID=A0A409X4Q5_PSICY|nr:hypothetical protein CVT25_003064 [Psilocybe cyanescens]
MASTTSKSSFGQALHFITDIKLHELEKQRVSYQSHAKILDEAKALGDSGDIIKKVEVLAKAVKSWTGSGSVDPFIKLVGGKLDLSNLEFWLQQAKKDPSFSREIAEGWASTLEKHIQHNVVRFDAAKLFGNLFNEWLASGDSVAVVYQASPDEKDTVAKGGSSADFKEKLISIIFDDHSVDADKLKEYLEGLFESEEGTKALDKLRKEIKSFSYWFKRQPVSNTDVKNAISGLLASGLMDEEKRTTLKAFQENAIVIDEIASVLSMRMAGIDSWAWPKEGIQVEFRRHLNGKYRAFTDPEIIDALLLHYIGVAWQIKLKAALCRIFEGKAWIRPDIPTHKVKEQRKQRLRGDDGTSSIQAARDEARKNHFFMTQLQDTANTPKLYDEAGDDQNTKNITDGAAIKQKLLHIMTTECYLNTALHGSHAAVCSDLEWFGPSLPHTSILTILEFFGMSKTWLGFYKAFLSTPVYFAGDTESRVRKRGTPISYSLSVLCGEAVMSIMDFAVNQRANGLYLYRMHDDLWLWDADPKKVADGWAEMNKYAELAGLKFNQKKTGSAYVGPPNVSSSKLPKGDIAWGFLKFDASESRFVINQADVDLHIVEMRRQLASTKSVFGWINAYNKYMAFFMRNFGGIPANCFSKKHILSMIDTLARIQRELFPGSDADGNGGAVGYLRKILKERFGVADLPEGYFYFPIGSGGLELRNTMLELFALHRQGRPLSSYSDHASDNEEGNDSEHSDSASEPGSDDSSDLDDYKVFEEDEAMADQKFVKRIENDPKAYKRMKEVWERDEDKRRARYYMGVVNDEFMSFEEFTSLRESWLAGWGQSYKHMLKLPETFPLKVVPKLREVMDRWKWSSTSWYEKWVVSMYGEEVMKKFGGLEVVDPKLIPVGMVQLFRSSRMKLDQ